MSEEQSGTLKDYMDAQEKNGSVVSKDSVMGKAVVINDILVENAYKTIASYTADGRTMTPEDLEYIAKITGSIMTSTAKVKEQENTEVNRTAILELIKSNTEIKEHSKLAQDKQSGQIINIELNENEMKEIEDEIKIGELNETRVHIENMEDLNIGKK